jgi:hypothetical protein
MPASLKFAQSHAGSKDMQANVLFMICSNDTFRLPDPPLPSRACPCEKFAPMANLDFYAVSDDLQSLLAFLFAETDVVIYELSSRHNGELRSFRGVTELTEAFDLGGSRTTHLMLWSPSVMAHPLIRRIEATQAPTPFFRCNIGRAGLIQFYLGGVQDGVIHHSHFGHWNEARAKYLPDDLVSDCDWAALRRVSGKIQRHIRGRCATFKLHSRPILHQAWDMVQQGYGLLLPPTVHRADSPALQRIRR